MINLVTGPPGNGKSYYGVRKVVQALSEGKPVATNVKLREDWPDVVLRHDWVRWAKPWSRRAFAREAPRRYFFSEDLDELFSVRFRGRGESRGVKLLDEAHNWMNARAWTAEDRARIVREASQHRKLGEDWYLLAQLAEMLDKQVRGMFEVHIQLRNLRRARFWGMPICPVNLFLAVHTWHSAQRVVLGREVFRLGYERRLYDTFQLSHGQQAAVGDGAIWLPLDEAPAPAASAPALPEARTDGRGTSSAGRDPASADALTPAAAAIVPGGYDADDDDETPDPETGDPAY
jgi:Zonular occludens toxin (Zot)